MTIDELTRDIHAIPFTKSKTRALLVTYEKQVREEIVGAIKKLYEDQCVEEIGFVAKGDKVWEALDNLK
jgi:hypothetical protein